MLKCSDSVEGSSATVDYLSPATSKKSRLSSRQVHHITSHHTTPHHDHNSESNHSYSALSFTLIFTFIFYLLLPYPIPVCRPSTIDHRQQMSMSRRPFSPNPDPISGSGPNPAPARLRFSIEEEEEDKPKRLGELFKRNQSNMFNMSIRAKAFLGGLPEEIANMRPSGMAIDVVLETKRKEKEAWWMDQLLKVTHSLSHITSRHRIHFLSHTSLLTPPPPTHTHFVTHP